MCSLTSSFPKEGNARSKNCGQIFDSVPLIRHTLFSHPKNKMIYGSYHVMPLIVYDFIAVKTLMSHVTFFMPLPRKLLYRNYAIFLELRDATSTTLSYCAAFNSPNK